MGVMFYVQMMKIKNTQSDVETTANNVVARLEYLHAGGDTFIVREGMWLLRTRSAEFPRAIFLPMEWEGHLIIFGQTESKDLFALWGDHNRKLQTGKWRVKVVKVLITADNCDPLGGEIGFTLHTDNQLVFDEPAFRLQDCPAAEAS